MLKKFSNLLTKEEGFYLKVLVNGAVRGGGAILAFTLNVLIARIMGASDAGTYFYAFAVVMFLSSIARAGTDNTVVRFTSKANAERNSTTVVNVLIKASLITAGLASAITIGLIFSIDALAYWLSLPPGTADTISFIAISIISFSLLTLVAMSFQGLHYVTTSIFIISVAVNALMLLSLLVFDLNTSSQLATAFSVSTTTVLILAILYWSSIVRERRGTTISWETLLQSSMPLWAITLLTQATMWSSQLIAGAFVTSSDLAQLVVAQKTAYLISFPLTAIVSVITPRFAALYSQNKLSEIAKLVHSSSKFLFLSTVPLVLVCFMLANQIMQLFGSGFEDSVILFRIMAISNLVNGITGPMSFLLMMSGHERRYRNIIYVAVPITLLLEFLFIPIFGVLGAAVIASLSAIVLNGFLVFQVWQLLGINPLSSRLATKKNSY